jgi:hypothetical protein
MIRNSFILVSALFLCMTLYSQNAIEKVLPASKILPAPRSENHPVKDTIQCLKTSGGYKYNFDNKDLTITQLGEMMQKNLVATGYLKKAKSGSGFANVFGYAGGFLIGYPLGTLIGGGKANWTMFAVGCGLVVIAIPIVSTANRNLKKAVNAYNHEEMTSNLPTYNLTLGINQSGPGLRLCF